VSRGRALLGGGGIALVVAAVAFWLWQSREAGLAAPRGRIATPSVFRFESGGKSVRIEEFAPDMPGRLPTVLLLHGSGGCDAGFADIARDFAGQGYVAMIVHYFDLPGVQASSKENSDRYFVQWMTLVGEAMKAAGKRPHVDPKRIALVGYSLGGYLALEVAGTNSDVAAAVDFFGGMSPLITRNLKHMPPTLLLHGARDQVVPVAEARTLEDLFTKNGFEFEIHIYPDQGHGFSGAAAVDARERTLRFLKKHLVDRKSEDAEK
jgi:dienelactone hydrolase